jgi:dUTP pyrophosphatase
VFLADILNVGKKMKFEVKKLHRDAKIPSYARQGDAGFDLHSVENYEIHPGKRELIKTGLAVAVPEGYELQIRPKSGLALKYGLSVLNSPGTVDSGYRGEVGIILINYGDEIYNVEKGEKIAQGVLNKIEIADFVEVEELEDSQRGIGGFGSTGR